MAAWMITHRIGIRFRDGREEVKVRWANTSYASIEEALIDANDYPDSLELLYVNTADGDDGVTIVWRESWIPRNDVESDEGEFVSDPVGSDSDDDLFH